MSLHDAVLIELIVDWEKKQIHVSLQVSPDERVQLIGHGLQLATIPIAEPWGPSPSVNKVSKPQELDSGLRRVEIEMQSGDVIELVAKSFDFPL